MKMIEIGGQQVGNDLPLTLIAGPCQLEGLEHALEIAGALKEACAASGVGLIFKSSFDKANRTSADAPRGVGMAAGLEILAEIKSRLGLPVLTDIHLPEQAAPVAEVADVLQIPAFLCRQTDLLIAAGQTRRVVNIKKGQFLAPWDMKRAAAKVAATGNEQVMLTERGSSFGYNALVADMRALPIMAETRYPVIMDATHAVQMPGRQGDATGG
ncbi:MAG: 3-deoxy-8-phosphooctulonate synthase, partial [Maritimibacter sp.]